PRLDVEQALATLADAEVSLTGAQNAVDVARAALATQLGLPAGTDISITPPSTLPQAPTDVQPLIAKALSSRPELTELNYQRQQLRANMDQIKLQQTPLVNATVGYSDTLAGTSGFSANGLNIGANVAFTAYNGGKTKASLAAARTQLAQIDTNQRQIELGITFDVRQAWLNMQNALKQLDSAKQQQVAADEALRISELRYENGEGIYLEVEQARLRSTQARTNLAQARFRAQNAAAQLEYAIGAPPTATTLPPAA
ncbi:MAG TPA: TolC family protein, partial [Armatimonadota bacterium]|nr:TolC family protein [Armatimonadota bacterium]